MLGDVPGLKSLCVTFKVTMLKLCFQPSCDICICFKKENKICFTIRNDEMFYASSYAYASRFYLLLYVIEMLIHGILHSCVMLFTKLYSLQISKRFSGSQSGRP